MIAQLDRLNGVGVPVPPASFRQGSASPRGLERRSLPRRKGGFSVKLPSGAPLTTPAVDGGRVFFSGGFHSREIYALDAKTGAFAWGLDLNDDGPSAPACEGGVCVFNTESCTIFAVDAAAGEVRWSWWLGDPLLCAPAVAGGRVFTAYPAPGRGEASHVLAAFDLATGSILWQRRIDADVISAPVVTGGAVYAATFAGTLWKFDAALGTILAAQPARATSAPSVIEGQVLFTCRTDLAGATPREAIATLDLNLAGAEIHMNERLAPYLDRRVQARSSYSTQGASLDASNGFAVGPPLAANTAAALGTVGQGSVSTLQAFQGSRVLVLDGRALSCMGDEVVAADRKTGQVLWRHRLAGDLGDGGSLGTAPVAAGPHVLVATLDGHVLALDPDTGAKRRSWRVGAPVRSQPVVQDGWLYLGTQDGRLVAIDSGDPSITGWAMWGGGAARAGGHAVTGR